MLTEIYEIILQVKVHKREVQESQKHVDALNKQLEDEKIAYDLLLQAYEQVSRGANTWGCSSLALVAPVDVHTLMHSSQLTLSHTCNAEQIRTDNSQLVAQQMKAQRQAPSDAHANHVFSEKGISKVKGAQKEIVKGEAWTVNKKSFTMRKILAGLNLGRSVRQKKELKGGRDSLSLCLLTAGFGSTPVCVCLCAYRFCLVS